MIDWVHEMCLDWGTYMRSNPKSWPKKNHAWRLWMEQGATGGDFGPSNPTWDMAESAAEVHRIWRTMPEDMRDLMLVFYGKRWSPKRKAKMLEISITRLYERRDHAHYYIVGRLDKKDSGISESVKYI